MRRILFKDACRLWMADKEGKVKETTLAAYSLIIDKHLIPRFRTLEDINPDSVRETVADFVRNNLSVNTIKSITLVLKMLIKHFERQGWMPRREYIARVPSTGDRSDPQVLSLKEEKVFVKWLREHPTRMNIGLLLCVCCGLRIGEVCALRWEDIDFRREVVRVNRTVYRIYEPDAKPRKTRLVVGPPKTGMSWREIPLAKFLIDLIGNLPIEGNEAFLLSGESSPADPQTFRNHFKRVLKTLGLPPRRVHSLRHSFATRCLESKCDFKTLSALLGHADITTTLNLYAHPDLNQKRRCIEDMIKII